jgi:FlaA1/EpsC-like NDP-sugar epimerase
METTIRELQAEILRLTVRDVFNDQRTKRNIKEFLKGRKGFAICIYGAGSIAQELLKRYDLSHMNILGFIDRDPKKMGKRLGGYKIYPPDALKHLNPDAVLLALSQNKEVGQYLEKLKKSNNLKFRVMKDIFQSDAI